MTAPADLAQDPQVRRWFESAKLDDDPEEVKTHKLALLADFCDHYGQQPGELVSGLLRTTKDGHTAIAICAVEIPSASSIARKVA